MTSARFFAMIPVEGIGDRRLSGADLTVLGALCYVQDWESHTCSPRITELVQKTNYPKRSVIRSLKNLEDFGYIQIQKKADNGVNIYSISYQKEGDTGDTLLGGEGDTDDTLLHEKVTPMTPLQKKEGDTHDTIEGDTGDTSTFSSLVISVPKERTPIGVPKKGVKTTPNRGTRLPEDWTPSEKDTDYAKSLGWSDERIGIIAKEFYDYWTTLSGQKAIKVKWSRVWEKWCDKANEWGTGAAKPAGYHPQSSFGENLQRAAEQAPVWVSASDKLGLD